MKLEKEIEQVIEMAKEQGISRRDMLKFMSVGGAAAMMGAATQASAATEAYAASGAKGKIVIVGAGLAGISVAAKLSGMLSNPDITIIDGGDVVDYQPGYTLIASGVYGPDDVSFKRADFIPSGVNWVKEYVTEFNPDENYVVTTSGQKISYDFLVVATGLQLNYGAVNGLSQDKIGQNGVASIYFLEGARKTWGQMQEFVNKGGEALFTDPATPIKCGGAPKKIQFLTDGYARKTGNRDKINTTFCPNGGAMFGVKQYAEAIEGWYKERGMNWKFKHNLTAIDTDAKKATFTSKYQVKGEYDEILKEYTMIDKVDEVVMDYDFIHVTPPMSAPDVVKNSPLAWQKGSAAAGGWVELNKETLQHARYANVFGLGDVAGIPMGKTGGSIRKQYKVMCENLVAAMEGKSLDAKYGGYTVCPLIVDYGKVALLEFDWSKEPTPSFPLDPTKARWIYWVMKVYMLKPMTMYGMLAGRA